MNKLFYGDNLEILRSREIRDESVDLVYIDPPFNSKRNYNMIYNNVGNEDKAQAQAFVDTWEWDDLANKGLDEIRGNYNRVFTGQSIDLIIGLEKVLGRGSLLAYLVSITLRIAEIHRVLKPTGSFYLHCDPTASHYLKLVLDAIFCGRGGNFRNEVVWAYRKWTNSIDAFQHNHDYILFYSKSNKYTFNKLMDESAVAEHYEKGYHTNTVKSGKGKISQLIVYDVDKAKKLIDSRRYDKVVYREGVNEVIMPDWWEISIINSQAKERLGYPTQKPEALLERIIQASSNEGDVVMDCYCGCGTSVAVAQRLGRQWIGVDITYQSISLILRRLEESFGNEVIKSIDKKGIPKDFESAVDLANKKDDRLRKEFEKWLILTYTKNKAIVNEKFGGDGGKDGVAYILDKDENGKEIYKPVIFSVKSKAKGELDDIRALHSVVMSEGAVRGIFLTLYRFENLVKESKKFGRYHNAYLDKDFAKIEVVCVEDILKDLFFDMPTSLEALKKAEFKQKGKQGTLELDDET